MFPEHMLMTHVFASHFLCKLRMTHLTLFFVQPADAAAVVMRFKEQLSEELPQVDGLAGIGAHDI